MTDSVPWHGVDVIVKKTGHVHKRDLGVVKNVLRGQETASGLKIKMQLTAYNPSLPNHSIVVDYDDVVEVK